MYSPCREIRAAGPTSTSCPGCCADGCLFVCVNVRHGSRANWAAHLRRPINWRTALDWCQWGWRECAYFHGARVGCADPNVGPWQHCWRAMLWGFYCARATALRPSDRNGAGARLERGAGVYRRTRCATISGFGDGTAQLGAQHGGRHGSVGWLVSLIPDHSEQQCAASKTALRCTWRCLVTSAALNGCCSNCVVACSDFLAIVLCCALSQAVNFNARRLAYRTWRCRSR